MKKKKVAMFCMSAFAAMSMAACSIQDDPSKVVNADNEQFLSQEAIKNKFSKKIKEAQAHVRNGMLPAESHFKMVNGARMVTEGDRILTVYEFVTDKGQYYNFLIEKGKESNEKILQSAGKSKVKSTPGKKQYYYDKAALNMYWVDNGNSYTLNSAQLSESEMIKIADSLNVQTTAPQKLLNFDSEEMVFPSYITESKTDSQLRTFVEYFNGNKNLEINVGNDHATIAQSKDAAVVKGTFDNLEEYQKIKPSTKNGNSGFNTNPYYAAFDQLKLKNAKGFIHIDEANYSEAYVKKDNQYYYIRVEAKVLKEKPVKGYFMTETQKMVDGLVASK